MYDPILQITESTGLKGLEIGKKFRKSELLKMYPFLNTDNQNYFTKFYEDKFKVGDKVFFIGKVPNWTELSKLKKMHTYIITGVEHKTWNHDLKTSYTIKDIDNSRLEFVIKEEELELVNDKWIISFSGCVPKAVQLDYGAWKRKIKHSSKDKFTFDTQEEAKKYAEMFNQFTPNEMYNALKESKHWHKMSEKLPPKGSEVLIAMKNKNKEDGIWLYDIAIYYGGDLNVPASWDNKTNYEVPLYWKYIDDPE